MPELPATSTQSALDIGTATDVGRVREANEDSFLAVRGTGARDGEALVAVADGMGGHKAGEVASALAIESLVQSLNDGDPGVEADTLLMRGLELHTPKQVDLDPRVITQRACKQVTEGADARFAFGYLASTHLLVHPRVIVRQQRGVAASKHIRPAVADV